MNVQIERSKGCLRIEGDMTVYTAADLKPLVLAALTAGGDETLLDLSQVGEFDSAGLQVLLAALNHSAAAGRPMSVVAASRAVLDVLELFRQMHLLSPAARKDMAS